MVISTPLHYCTSLHFLMQPLDIAFFRVWRAAFERLHGERLMRHRVAYGDILKLGMEAWKSMFHHGSDDTFPVPNMGVIRAFASAGISPLNPSVISDNVFKPAEVAGKALRAAKSASSVTSHVPDPSPAEAQAMVDKIMPLLPPVPVDMASAVQVARKSRSEKSELLTGHEYHVRAAADVLAKAEVEAAKQRKREVAAAKKAASAADRVLKAEARAAKASAAALKPPKKRRTSKPLQAAGCEVDAKISDGTVLLAGQKRRSEAMVTQDDGGAAKPLPHKVARLHLVVRTPTG